MYQQHNVNITANDNTHCALVLYAVVPILAGRELPPDGHGTPSHYHLTHPQYSSVGVIEGEGDV